MTAPDEGPQIMEIRTGHPVYGGGLYNMVFGHEDGREFIAGDGTAKLLGLTDRHSFGRYRDVWVERDPQGDPEFTIRVYARNGGKNRRCTSGEKFDCEVEECYGCIQTHRLPAHRDYVRDEDDTYDSTYCSTWFRMPDTLPVDEYRIELLKTAVPYVDTGKRWAEKIAEIKRAGSHD